MNERKSLAVNAMPERHWFYRNQSNCDHAAMMKVSFIIDCIGNIISKDCRSAVGYLWREWPRNFMAHARPTFPSTRAIDAGCQRMWRGVHVALVLVDVDDEGVSPDCVNRRMNGHSFFGPTGRQAETGSSGKAPL